MVRYAITRIGVERRGSRDVGVVDSVAEAVCWSSRTRADRVGGRRWSRHHCCCSSAGVSQPTVIKWRNRFAAHGLAGLDDEPRSGRPKSVDDAAIIAATLEPPPQTLGVTHWSSRLLGRHLGIGDATVARAWRKYGVKPWRRETFKFSTDPELEAKVRDVVGLYLNPRAPRGADESSGGERPSPPPLSQQER